MAKYTELLAEYLEAGGQLPARFDDINGFKDLFIGEYCDREIGFETPTLFAIKLETRANLIFPAYLARIQELEEARDNLINPTKKRVKSGNIKRNYGQKDTEQQNIIADHTSGTAEQPFNITPNAPDAFSNPSNVTTDKGYTDTVKNTEQAREDTETYDNLTDTETGFTSSEAEALYKALESEVFIIERELLKEFNNLFMAVY